MIKEPTRRYWTSENSRSNGMLFFHDYVKKFPKHYWTSGFFSLGDTKKFDGLYWYRKHKHHKHFRFWRYRRWIIRREWYGYFYPSIKSRF